MVPEVEIALMTNLRFTVFGDDLLYVDTPIRLDKAQPVLSLFCAKNDFYQLSLIV